ncbi:MAG: NAD-dependent malic enzyme [Prevotella melaninogenica]|jgi:malic enzyme, NAD binding domain protein|uniref:malolactic enzyme n=1 Tax=Prevotella sp. TaxID=59823 RepID=UPI001CB35013|nr:malolactic enzyme [Prevotella sp.]MBF1431761.1 NAD-dependent malic enzyme [Prevotella melaninogenica]MBF1596994.1 NAD-dependent malic enzyme [Prevotella sp.]MBF1635959.1 NAD-dependent malic enzyme [Prevotella sp.]
MKTAQEILNDPFINKGTAFTLEERKALNLVGVLPTAVQTLEEQTEQTYKEYQKKVSDLEKRIYLMTLFNTNRTLFYALMSQHVAEFMPIVYDPTVADAIREYDELFMKPQDAAFLSIHNPDDIEEALKNAAGDRDIRLIVVTDAEEILGIGDWGVGGVAISIGKLMVYTAAAGVNPEQVLPLVLDVGTNNQKLINDPLYLGNRHPRVRGKEYFDFIDKFVTTAEKLFPRLYLHWEDFGRSTAATILEKYQNRITTFNDDVQGTGIVALAGILGALEISKEKFTDQRVMIFGAGTAGVGIATQIFEEFKQQGLSEAEARSHIYLIDKQGLLFEDTEGLTDGQKRFVRQRDEFENADSLKDLYNSVKTIHPSVLIGTSTTPGMFNEQVVKEMASAVKRPIIFPLSNPTELAEATAKDLIHWTDGQALIATGIPSEPVVYNGITYNIGQANNALMYPGLGLGVIASTVKLVNQTLLSAAAHALGGFVDASKPGAAVLPPVEKLTEFSEHIAIVVTENAMKQGLTREKIEDARKAVDAMKWYPKYK